MPPCQTRATKGTWTDGRSDREQHRHADRRTVGCDPERRAPDPRRSRRRLRQVDGTIVDRYIALLDRDPPLEPREILVFTFTDKAAGELRQKVREKLQERAREMGDLNPDAVSMSDAWVGTFHAIYNRILKAWPMEAGIDPGFSVLDSTSSETIMKAAFDRAVWQVPRRRRGPRRSYGRSVWRTESKIREYDRVLLRRVSIPRNRTSAAAGFRANSVSRRADDEL